MTRMKVTNSMDDFFDKQLENALAHYDKVIFLYQLSEESYSELRTILRAERRKLLLLTDMEAPDFPYDQKKLCEEECGRLLELYLSYSFSDHFIFLTDQKDFPWPSIANFAEAGLATRRELLEVLLK